MKLKKVLAALLACAMVASFSACGGSEGAAEGDTATPGESGTAASGEETLDEEQYVNLVLSNEPSSMDPGKSSDVYSASIMVDILEPLVRLEDISGESVITPAGAESWETSEDGLTWTFHLRDNTWSDGVAVTAKDYEYGIKRTADPATGSPNSFFLSPLVNADAVMAGEMSVDELGVKAIDDKTLEITLSHPTPWFLGLTYQKAMMPVRQDLVEKYGETFGAEQESLVSCGPFKVTSWTHNSEMVLEKNDTYWDKDTVKLETIHYSILTDENAVLNSLDNNSVDQAGVTKKEWMERFNQRDDMTYVTYTQPKIQFLHFNVADETVGNVNIRKALSLAIDREDFNEVIYKGVNTPAYGWIPPTVDSGSSGEYRSLVDEPLKKLAEENPDPKALLEQGMQELGISSPSDLHITMSVSGTDQWNRTFAEYLQQVWSNTLGINVEMEFYEWATFDSNVHKGDYQVGTMAWTMDYNDPMGMLELLKSTSASIVTNWVNEEYDSLIDQATQEADDAKRLELYKRAEEILLYEDCVVCPDVYMNVSMYRYNYLKGVPTNTFTTYSQGMKYAYTSGR